MSAATELRPVVCPACTQIIGACDQPHGTLKVFCRRCRKWRLVNLADPSPRRRDADRPVRIVTEGPG